MSLKRRLAVENLENRCVLSATGPGPAVDVCAKVPDHPNCVVIGDATGDGIVDNADVGVLFTNLPLYEEGQCATFEQGDFDLDGELTSGDLVLLFQNLGNTEQTFIPGLPRQACPPPDHAAADAAAGPKSTESPLTDALADGLIASSLLSDPEA